MPKITYTAGHVLEPGCLTSADPLTGALLRGRKAFSLPVIGFLIYAATFSQSWLTHIRL